MEGWITQHSELIQNIGIIFTGILGSFSALLSAYAFRRQELAWKTGNTISIAERHNAIWKEASKRPELSRINDERADLAAYPLSNEERRFVTALVQHLSVVYEALHTKMIFPLPGLDRDVRNFFSRDVPKAVWNDLKQFQAEHFIAYVERCTK